jgi:hypothetical protein
MPETDAPQPAPKPAPKSDGKVTVWDRRGHQHRCSPARAEVLLSRGGSKTAPAKA